MQPRRAAKVAEVAVEFQYSQLSRRVILGDLGHPGGLPVLDAN